MKVHGLELETGTVIKNANIRSAEEFPSDEVTTRGQLFFKSDEDILYVRNNANDTWIPVSFDEFAELVDVDITGVVDGQSIAFDEASGKWMPFTIEVSEQKYLNDLQDVDVVDSTAAGAVLMYNMDSNMWEGANASGVGSVSQLIDDMETDGTITHDNGAGFLVTVDLNSESIPFEDDMWSPIGSPSEFGLVSDNVRDAILEVKDNVDSLPPIPPLVQWETLKTVGVGKDFETLQEALDWYTTLSAGGGYESFLNRASVRLNLDDGDHHITKSFYIDGGPSLVIVAASEAVDLATIVIDTGIWCTFQNLSISFLYVDIDGSANSGNVMFFTNCSTSMTFSSVIGGGVQNVRASGGTINLSGDGAGNQVFDGQMVLMDAYANFSGVTFDGPNISGGQELIASINSTINIGVDVKFTNTPTFAFKAENSTINVLNGTTFENIGGDAFYLFKGSVVHVEATPTLTNVTGSLSNIPVNQQRKDGSAIWVKDDSTKQTFEDGETPLDETEMAFPGLGIGSTNIDLDGGQVITADVTADHTFDFTSGSGKTVIQWVMHLKNASGSNVVFYFDGVDTDMVPGGDDVTAAGWYTISFVKSSSFVSANAVASL